MGAPPGSGRHKTYIAFLDESQYRARRHQKKREALRRKFGAYAALAGQVAGNLTRSLSEMGIFYGWARRVHVEPGVPGWVLPRITPF